MACNRCNASKGPNVAGIDGATGGVVALFHPRRDVWAEHFKFAGPRIVGLSAIGRATVSVLKMNDERRVELRAELLVRGELP